MHFGLLTLVTTNFCKTVGRPEKMSFSPPFPTQSMLKIPSVLLKFVSRVGDFFQLVSNIDLGERGEQGKKT